MLARTEESRAGTELQIPHRLLPSSSGFAPISPACEESRGGSGQGDRSEGDREEEGSGLEPRVAWHRCSPVVAFRVVPEPRKNDPRLWDLVLEMLELDA